MRVKELKVIASSVRGASSCRDRFPTLLESKLQEAENALKKGRVTLARMIKKAKALEPGAPSMEAEAKYWSHMNMIKAYEKALEELEKAVKEVIK